MSKSNAFENSLLLLVFNNTNIALVGDATGLRGSSTVGSLYASLHTADPVEAGSQTTNESTYGRYARVAVARTSGAWTVSGNQVSNVSVITFPAGTTGTVAQNITHVGIGTDSSGAGTLLYKCALSTAIYSGTGITPQLNASTGVVITED